MTTKTTKKKARKTSSKRAGRVSYRLPFDLVMELTEACDAFKEDFGKRFANGFPVTAKTIDWATDYDNGYDSQLCRLVAGLCGRLNKDTRQTFFKRFLALHAEYCNFKILGLTEFNPYDQLFGKSMLVVTIILQNDQRYYRPLSLMTAIFATGKDAQVAVTNYLIVLISDLIDSDIVEDRVKRLCLEVGRQFCKECL